jgi:hypothetical protein
MAPFKLGRRLKLGDPVDWMSWIYGKCFQGHPWRGGIVICGVGTIVFIVVVALIYIRGVEKWNKENAEHSYQEKNALRSSTDSAISGEFLNLYVTGTGDHQQDTLVTITLRIKNLGTPTSLEHIRFAVSRDGKEFRTEFPPVGQVLNLLDAKGKVIASLAGNDHIGFRAGTQAVQTNVPANCWFSSLIFGMNQGQFLDPKTAKKLVFRDVASGEEHSMDFTKISNPIEVPDWDKIAKQTKGNIKPPPLH